MDDLKNNTNDNDRSTGRDLPADHNLDEELKDLIEQSALKSEALKKMMQKLNESKNTDPGK